MLSYEGAIVSNPPYIADHDAQAPAHLHPGAWLLLEHGYDQATGVRGLLVAAGFAGVQLRQDLAGIARCSGGYYQGSCAPL